MTIEQLEKELEKAKKRIAKLEANEANNILAKNVLEESEDKWRSLFYNAPNFIVITDLAGIVQFVNYTLENIEKESTIGKSFFEYIQTKNHKAAQEVIEQVRKTGEPASYICSGGGVLDPALWFEVRVGAIKKVEQVVSLIHFVVDITEQKRTEEELKSEKRLSEEYINSLPGLFYIFDEEKFVKRNKEWNRITGYSDEELNGMYGPDFFEGSDKTLIKESMMRVLTEGEAEAEAELVTKDGRRIPYYFTGLLRKFGGKEHIIGLGIDITERKRAEEELKKSEEKYRLLFDNANIFISIFDRSGTCRMMNKMVAKSHGGVPEDYVGKSFKELHPDMWEEYTRRIVEVIDTGKPNDYVDLGHFSEGDLYLSSNVIPVSDARGSIYAAQIISQDITERKRAEEALYKSDELIRAITESAQDSIFCKDLDLKYTFVNPAMEQLIGLSASEIIGKKTAEIFGEKEALTIDKVDKIALSDQVANKIRSLTIDGKEYFFHTIQTTMCDEKGNVNGICGIVRDVTASKRAEEERRSLEAQMQHVQKLESLGILAGGIAHDFNNLLMAILGNADLALREIPPASPARQNLEDISKASQRAAGLCRQMLAFSGKGRFVIEALNIQDLVKEMSHMLKVSISKKVALRYNFTDNFPYIEADATQMRQIFMNLITNASEAIGDKSGVISINTGAMDCKRADLAETYLDEDLPEGNYVYIEVEDTGCGMDPETLDKMFDPFFTTKFTGRGLGMAAVLGIVRGHKGAIKIYSEIDKGTTIKVLLPALQDANKICDHPGKITQEPEEWSFHGTVLLVDDEDSVLETGEKMLGVLGFEVLTAKNGLEAVEIYKKHMEDISIILLDLTMPKMDGEEAFRMLHILNKDVLVIMSSGYNEQEVTQIFEGKGLAGFIQKPYKIALLAKKIKEVLD